MPLATDGIQIGAGTGLLPAATSAFRLTSFQAIYIVQEVDATADPDATITRNFFENMRWQLNVFSANISTTPEALHAINHSLTFHNPNFGFKNGNVDVVSAGFTMAGSDNNQYHAFLVTLDATETLSAFNADAAYSLALTHVGYVTNEVTPTTNVFARVGSKPGLSTHGSNFRIAYGWDGNEHTITGYTNLDLRSSGSVVPAYRFTLTNIPSPATPYQTWAHAAFSDLPGTFQHLDAAISADPDGDGLGNGLEYTFSSNPRDPCSGRAQAPAATSSGCFFLLPTTVPSGIQLRVEGSGNLTNWTTHATRPSGGPWTGPVALTPDGSFTRHTFTDPAPSTRRFFRLAAQEQ